MAQVRTDAIHWIHQRCCPRCGYAGCEIQRLDEHSPYQCPNCDEDLYARLPLTYAEREGLVPCAGQPKFPGVQPAPRPTLTIRVLIATRSLLRRLLRR